MAVKRELEEQLRLTADLVDHRLGLGDRPELVRRVDHAAYFRRKSFAASAADELASLGYEVTIRRSYLRTALEFRRDSPVDHVSADKFTRQVVAGSG